MTNFFPNKSYKKSKVRLRTSEEWCRYFAINAKSLIDIPWEKGITLSNEEYRAITRSVRGFQRGGKMEM